MIRSSAARAASCWAAFFDVALARRRPPRPSIRHSTRKRRRWLGPSSATTPYSGTGSPRACSSSCSALFASSARQVRRGSRSVANSALHERGGGGAGRRRGRARRSPPRRRSPRASAFLRPPVFSSPRPRRSSAGRPSALRPLGQARRRDERGAALALARPRGRPGSRRCSRSATTKPSTASPRNSSASLWPAPDAVRSWAWLACVSARSSSKSSWKRWPRRSSQRPQRLAARVVRRHQLGSNTTRPPTIVRSTGTCRISRGGHREQVRAEHHAVGQLARDERALVPLGPLGARGAARVEVERLLQRDLLLREPAALGSALRSLAGRPPRRGPGAGRAAPRTSRCRSPPRRRRRGRSAGCRRRGTARGPAGPPRSAGRRWRGWAGRTRSRPARGSAPGRRGRTICACSMRNGRGPPPFARTAFSNASSTTWFARSPIACTARAKPAASARWTSVLQLGGLVEQEPACSRARREYGCVHGGGAGAQRAVREDLERPQPHPVVAQPRPHAGRDQRRQGADGAPHATGARSARRGRAARGRSAARRSAESSWMVVTPRRAASRECRPRRAPVQLARGLGDHAPHEIHRVVHQRCRSARRAASRSMRPPRRILGVRGRCPASFSASEFAQRQVAVEAVHEHGMVGRGRVDRRARRAAVRPASAGGPSCPGGSRCRRGSVRACAASRRARSASSFGAAQVDREQAVPSLQEVHVRVVEAGHHEAAAQVHHARVRRRSGRARRGSRPTATTRPAARRQRLRARAAQARPDRPAAQHEVRLRRRTAAGSSSCRPTCSSTIVMSSCCAVPAANARTSARMRSLSGSLAEPGRGLQQVAQALLAEQLRARVHRLRQPVGEEQEEVAGHERHLRLLQDVVEAVARVDARGPGPAGVSTRVRPVAASSWMSGLWPGAREAHGARRRCPRPRRSW